MQHWEIAHVLSAQPLLENNFLIQGSGNRSELVSLENVMSDPAKNLTGERQSSFS